MVVSNLTLVSGVGCSAVEDGADRSAEGGWNEGDASLLPTYLPAKGLQRDTVRYAVGPLGYQAMGATVPPEIVGFDKAAEVVTAKYEGKGALTMLLYPTPQIAGDHGRQMEARNEPAGVVGGHGEAAARGSAGVDDDWRLETGGGAGDGGEYSPAK